MSTISTLKDDLEVLRAARRQLLEGRPIARYTLGDGSSIQYWSLKDLNDAIQDLLDEIEREERSNRPARNRLAREPYRSP